MLNELQIFTEAAASDMFVWLSAVFALIYAACAVGLVAEPSAQTDAANVDRSPRLVTQAD